MSGAQRFRAVWAAAAVVVFGLAAVAVGQDRGGDGVTVVEGIDVVAGRTEEAVYYYTNNWLTFREAALEKGYIDSYELIVGDSTTDDVDILLITRFASERQYLDVEERYTELMGDHQLVLLNEVQPGEFRRSVFWMTSTGARPEPRE